jgi:hypothetical protein
MNGRIYFPVGKIIARKYDGCYFQRAKGIVRNQDPVMRTDGTRVRHATPDEMMKEMAQSYQVSLSAQSAPDCFREVIKSLCEQTGQKSYSVSGRILRKFLRRDHEKHNNHIN